MNDIDTGFIKSVVDRMITQLSELDRTLMASSGPNEDSESFYVTFCSRYPGLSEAEFSSTFKFKLCYMTSEYVINNYIFTAYIKFVTNRTKKFYFYLEDCTRGKY